MTRLQMFALSAIDLFTLLFGWKPAAHSASCCYQSCRQSQRLGSRRDRKGGATDARTSPRRTIAGLIHHALQGLTASSAERMLERSSCLEGLSEALRFLLVAVVDRRRNGGATGPCEADCIGTTGDYPMASDACASDARPERDDCPAPRLAPLDHNGQLANHCISRGRRVQM